MRVFHKLVVSSVAFSLLVAGMGHLAAVHSQRTLKETVRRGSVIVVTETMDKIDRCIQRRLEELEVYVTTERFRRALAESNEQFDRSADPLGRLHQRDAEWIASPKHSLNTWMQTLLDRRLSEALRAEIEMEDVYRARYGYPLFGEVFATNKYGANVGQTGWTSDYDQSDEPWWQHARARGVYVGDIAYDESSGIYALDLAVAATGTDGGFAGVLKAVLNVEEVIGVIEQVKSASEHRSTTIDLLSDASGILYHIGPLDLSGNPARPAEPLSGRQEPGADTQDVMARTPDGITTFVVCAPSKGYRDFAGLSWTLRMGYDADEILQPAIRLRKALLASWAAMAVAALLGGLLIARHIATPIVRLTEAARIVSERNDYSIRAPQAPDGEMRTLVETFNTMLDQTQRHEQALIAANEQLGVEVVERQRAQQEQRQLFDQLQEKNRELNDFAYVVSHDLKAPLRGIQMLAEWFEQDYRDRLDEEGTEQLGLLRSRVTRMRNLIDGILQYSRFEGMEEEIEPTDLNELVAEIIEALAPPEHITIVVEGTLPTFTTSRVRFTQIFQNLISNAIKYMDKPAGRIEIGCTEEAGRLTFHVADNGPGIDREQYENIFRMFQTLAPHDQYESTGIGLALVRKIVTLFGGRVWLESEIGSGSTFFFTFPLESKGTSNEKLQTRIVS